MGASVIGTVDCVGANAAAGAWLAATSAGGASMDATASVGASGSGCSGAVGSVGANAGAGTWLAAASGGASGKAGVVSVTTVTAGVGIFGCGNNVAVTWAAFSLSFESALSTHHSMKAIKSSSGSPSSWPKIQSSASGPRIFSMWAMRSLIKLCPQASSSMDENSSSLMS